MRKTTFAALLVTAPLLFIVLREAGKLFAGVTGEPRRGPSPLLWIAGILMALMFLWVGVILSNRVNLVKKGGLSFEMVAAMAMAEANKKAPAGQCGGCGRARLSEKSPRCLFCGAAFASASASAQSSPTGQGKI